MIEIKKYKGFAKIQLKDRWTIPVILTLIGMLVLKLFDIPFYINLIKSGFFSQETISELFSCSLKDFFSSFLQFIASSTNTTAAASSQALDFLLTIIQLSFQFIFTIGLLNVYLAMSRTPEKVPFKNFFEGLNEWSRGLAAGFYILLWILLWTMLFVVSLTIVFSIMAVIFSSDVLGAMEIFGPIIFLISLVPALIKTLSYSQTFFLVAEYQNLSIPNALRTSMTITKGHKTDVFLADLSFIGWFILSFLTFGIAGLWITPYYRMTMTNVYHALLKEALEKEILKPEDLQ